MAGLSGLIVETEEKRITALIANAVAVKSAENMRLRDALRRSHDELMQYAWYEQGLTGLRERNERALEPA
jgi:hypothetical protein